MPFAVPKPRNLNIFCIFFFIAYHVLLVPHSLPFNAQNRSRTNTEQPDRKRATMSSQNSTLIDDDKQKLPPLLVGTTAQPRTYKSVLGSIEREGEDAEREMADFGGDAPVSPIGRKRAGTGGRRMSRSTTPAFPPLHLVDSAFAEAHRARSISGQSFSLLSLRHAY